MILEIEKWKAKQNFSFEVNSLFEESAICYKASAYRASLLFSYLGLMTILKNRILNSAAPTDFIEIEWRGQYQNKLLNDSNWDTFLFDLTQQTAKGNTPKKIFDISDDLREQVKFWKNRRNDCAHAKDQKISYYHVEAFWAFMYSNLPKLMVGGGFEGLINRINNHFDTSLTLIDEDCSTLVTEIDHAIEKKQLIDFFGQVEGIIINHSIDITTNRHKKRHLDFWDKILKLCTDPTKDGLIEYLKANENRIEDFIQAYPQRIQELSLSSTFVKNFWTSKEVLFPRDVRVVLAMYSSRMIKEAEFPDLIDKLLKSSYIDISDSEVIRLLEELGYFKSFKKTYLNGDDISDFNVGNRISRTIIWMIENNGFNKELVKTICGTLDKVYYPFDLSSKLKDLFLEKPQLKDEFIAIAQTNEIRIPKFDFITTS